MLPSTRKHYIAFAATLSKKGEINMNLNLRKFTKFVDKTFIEGGKEAKELVLLVSDAAVIKNPK